MMDVLVASTQLHLPILVEYDEFRKLQINAATDGLTGLYNRRLFNEYCDNEVNRARRYNQQLAVVILDLHRLKEVNDRNGHLKGDEALRLAATTLRKTLRASDLAFRIGGDEFALLLPETDPEQAAKLCKRVRALYESQVASLELDMTDVTLDFGVAVLPNDGEEKEALLRLADERLYQLKFAGRVNNSRVIPIEAPQARETAPRETAPPAVRETRGSSTRCSFTRARRSCGRRRDPSCAKAGAILRRAAQVGASFAGRHPRQRGAFGTSENGYGAGSELWRSGSAGGRHRRIAPAILRHPARSDSAPGSRVPETNVRIQSRGRPASRRLRLYLLARLPAPWSFALRFDGLSWSGVLMCGSTIFLFGFIR